MQLLSPYPGLRPFNEDESIFFKGRDEQIVTLAKQLEQRKFLMITGASGDGKSSLVYAGLVPYARAGFFKAKFNNWVLVDFRPERSPLRNLAVSLDNRLRLKNPDHTKEELSYGFSALVDIYKRSSYFLDTNTEEWNLSDDKEKRKRKAKAGNLLILLDQFEEFFTNKENYSNGKSTAESQLVLNVLLETMKIAQQEDLPIYIVFTMRSDYIGQCASFRGLPEAIGFSQFFVPRLKRKELQQVIEEPAKLNGNQISRRLSELLLNETNDGIDQLPVLQHTLNLIWKQADMGQKTLDLLQFAQVAGLNKTRLAKEDLETFEEWFASIEDSQKQWFLNPSLEEVLDYHANLLYERAVVSTPALSKDDANYAISTTFKCLTKVDNGRAVRSRMSVAEVLQVINRPNIGLAQLNAVLKPFREQGNTFLRPFIEEEAFIELEEKDILDITHESLIRNWGKLDEWAKEEEENKQIFKDFEKQLNRWISSGYSKDFLLPIGPLTYFEDWFNKQAPNAAWLYKNDESDLLVQEKKKKAVKVLEGLRSYLLKSSRRLLFSRLFIRYGANKIMTAVGLFLILVGCGFYYNDYLNKQNKAVAVRMLNDGNELIGNRYTSIKGKAIFALNWEKHHGPGSFKQILARLNEDNNDTLGFDVGFQMFTIVQELRNEKSTTDYLTPQILNTLDSLLNKAWKGKNSQLADRVKRWNKLAIASNYYYRISGNEIFKKLATANAETTADAYLIPSLTDTNFKNQEPHVYFQSMVLAMNLLPKDKQRISKLYSSLLGGSKNAVFNRIFPENQDFKTTLDEASGSKFLLYSKGGYYLLACLAELNNRPSEAIEYMGKAAVLQGKVIKPEEYSLFVQSLKMDLLSYAILSGKATDLPVISAWIFEENQKSTFDNLANCLISSLYKPSLEGYYLDRLSFRFSDKPTIDFAINELGKLCNFSLSPLQKAKLYKAMAIYRYTSGDEKGANQWSEKMIALLRKALDESEQTDMQKVAMEDLVKFPDFQELQLGNPNYLLDLNPYTNSDPASPAVRKVQDVILKEKSIQAVLKIEGVKKYWSAVIESKLVDDNLDSTFWKSKESIVLRTLANDSGSSSALQQIFPNDEAPIIRGLIRLKSNSQKSFSFDSLTIDSMVLKKPDLLSALTKQLADCGAIKQSLFCLGKLPARLRKNTIADIVIKMNTTFRQAEFMPVFLNKAFEDREANPQYPNLLFGAISSAGGMSYINSSYEMIKEVKPSNKPTAIFYFIRGLAKNKLFNYAYKYIPSESSSNTKLQLLNAILVNEDPVVDSSDLDWKKLTQSNSENLTGAYLLKDEYIYNGRNLTLIFE